MRAEWVRLTTGKHPGGFGLTRACNGRAPELRFPKPRPRLYLIEGRAAAQILLTPAAEAHSVRRLSWILANGFQV